MSHTPTAKGAASADRRGCHRQHVNRLAQRLEPFFHFHAEPLLFVDDYQAQIVKRHVVLRQPMRADDDVDRRAGQTFHHVALSFGVQNRDSDATVTGNSAIRDGNVRKCCSARIVVGTSTATW